MMFHHKPRGNRFLISHVTKQLIVNLCKRMGEERRGQTLCDKCDNNFVQNNFSPFLKTDIFVKDQKTLVLSEDHDKTRK